jgi:hypothetical protein
MGVTKQYQVVIQRHTTLEERAEILSWLERLHPSTYTFEFDTVLWDECDYFDSSEWNTKFSFDSLTDATMFRLKFS